MSGSRKLEIRLKRIYEEPAPNDGFRCLVDRIWPRGISKEKAGIDDWKKELAPSTRLRKWFGHDPDRFDGFRKRYMKELNGHRGQLSELRRRARNSRLTLVYAARDEEHNQAVVLRDVLRRGLPKS